MLNVTNPAENVYNKSQIRTRNCVERSYDVWKRWFQVLATDFSCRLETVQSITVACAMPHNIAIDQNESQPSPEMPEFSNVLAATQVPSKSTATNNVRA